MNKKILVGLILLGVIFVGSATYALFNENILLGLTADVATNDSSIPNNQSNIQNNTKNIVNSENLNSSFNKMANVVLNDIVAVNDNLGQKVVKEVYRVTVGNRTEISYDDSSFMVLMGNETYHFKSVLTRIYDTNGINGGYLVCADCRNYIPVGSVLGVVPENYLCNCPDEHPKNVKDVPYVYSEESVLEYIRLNENSVKIVNNISNVDSRDMDIVENINDSNQITQDNIENTYMNIEDSYSPIVLPHMSDHMDLQWIKPQLMNPSFNNEELLCN